MPIPNSLGSTETRFSVTSSLEIQALLHSIQKSKGLLFMQAKEGNASIATAILAIDPTTNTFVVDNSSGGFDQRVMAAKTAMFETVLDKVRIQFTGSDIKVFNHDGLTALKLTIPATLTRLQRRENYRIDTFVSEPASCTFTLVQKSGNKATIHKNLPIKDISAGGISVWDNDYALDDGKSTTYTACQLDLPTVGTIETDLRVVQTIHSTLPNEKGRRLIGLEFVDLPGLMQSKVQNYISTLERKLIAKKRGYE